jgi:hypothetical protein
MTTAARLRLDNQRIVGVWVGGRAATYLEFNLLVVCVLCSAPRIAAISWIL